MYVYTKFVNLINTSNPEGTTIVNPKLIPITSHILTHTHTLRFSKSNQIYSSETLSSFKILAKKMAMSITKKHSASFNSSIVSLMSSTLTFPKQPQVPSTNDFNAIVVSRSLSEDPFHPVNFFTEKMLKGFKFDMSIYPSLIYACVRVNSVGTLPVVVLA